ncbi:MAG: S8 family peptidase, partial [Casimicrobiaceae bacterium]
DRMHMPLFVSGKIRLCLALGLAVAMVALAAGAQSSAPEMTPRLIVKLRDAGTLQTQAMTTARLDRVAADAASAGVAITYQRPMAIGAHVMALQRPLTLEAARALAARIAQNPDVEFVQPDVRRHKLRTTNDTFLSSQPYLGTVTGGINAFGAWDVTTGSPNVVVAVVDTGYRPHADLAGRVLPGYDFVSDSRIANDGDGRDADPTDPGDWINATDKTNSFFKDCDIEDSSWHGTSVTGVIAANSNNGQWLAGIDWAAKILPVRALGKCGGDDSDIMDGVVWAAGLSVPGVPANPNPAQIINLSVGGAGPCDAGYHAVFGAALAHGVTRAIVVAAGNESTDVSGSLPANCSEAIAVAATLNSGFIAGYSNFGAGVALSAPGGSSNDLQNDSIAILYNHGKTAPDVDAWAIGAGTSFSAPIVSAVASLVLGLAPNLTAAQLRSLLTATASPFPPGSDCDAARCGAGIVNARAAVTAAQSGGAVANYQGMWWAGPPEDGWGINFAHQGNIIFGTWFTYDTAGKGWWMTLITDNNPSPGVFTGTLFATTGPPFYTVPFVKPATATAVLGGATLNFTDVNNASFHYDVSLPTGMVSQTKAITRQPLGAAPFATCTAGGQSLAAATNYQDIWWAGTSANPGTEQGWGLNLAHQGDIIFASWFTYDSDRTPLWLVATAPKIAPGVYQGTFYRPSGPRFDAYSKAQYAPNPPLGTMTLTFADGNNATFAYSVTVGPFPGPVSQTKSITRQLFSATGTTCQ